MLPPLTKKQREVLDCIEGFVKDNGYTPSNREIAEQLGLSSPATIHQHIKTLCEKGIINTGDHGTARSIELVETGPMSPLAIMLPLAGLITAVEPIEAVEQNEAMAIPADFVVDPMNSYILKVKGRSMIEDGIFDGDYVIVERNPSPKNGDIVVALLDNIRNPHALQEPGHTPCQPANSTMQPYREGDLNIQGIVRAVMRRFSTI